MTQVKSSPGLLELASCASGRVVLLRSTSDLTSKWYGQGRRRHPIAIKPDIISSGHYFHLNVIRGKRPLNGNYVSMKPLVGGSVACRRSQARICRLTLHTRRWRRTLRYRPTCLPIMVHDEMHNKSITSGVCICQHGHYSFSITPFHRLTRLMLSHHVFTSLLSILICDCLPDCLPPLVHSVRSTLSNPAIFGPACGARA